MYEHSNNRKGNHDLGRRILQTQIFLYALVIWNKVFSEYIHRIEKHLDMAVEVLDVQISVAFELYFYEEFIEFLWANLMFESPHTTNICIMTTLQRWRSLVLAGTIMVGSQAFGEYFSSGEDFKILIWSIIYAIIAMRSSVIFFVFTS